MAASSVSTEPRPHNVSRPPGRKIPSTERDHAFHGPPPPPPVKQDMSSGGSVDTTKTRSDPQRVRKSSGERPIGAAKGTQSDTEALCQPLPPLCPCPSYTTVQWADPGLEEMPSEVSSSGEASGENSELEGGWESETDALLSGSGDSGSTTGSSGSCTESCQSGVSECSTEVSDNPCRKRHRGLGGRSG